MVNDPVQPPNPNNKTPPATPDTSSKKPHGSFQFSKGHKYLGMQFSAKEWTQFMNILTKSLSDYISKTYDKMTKKMKADWKRADGEDVDDQ
jgi:hypothetical protein